MPEGHFINDYVAINYSKNDKDDLVHFLTHIETGMRTEDLKDLLSPTASTIFTSSVNAYILKVHFKYEQNVVPIEMGKSYQIYTKNRKMFIFTCLRSYYNCGSMILIARGDFGTMMYTGFCAIDFNSLNVPIVKEIIRQRSLSKLYLDCTYYKNYLEFFSISDIKKVLVQFFRSRKNRFYIHVPIFGLEDLLGHVAMILEEVMVVDEKRMTLIQFLGLSEHFTLDKTKGRLHVISQGIMKRNNENETSQLVYIKVVNELSHNSNSYMNHGKIHFFTIYPHCTNKDCTDIINNTRPDSLIQIGSIKSQNSSESTENVTESSNNTLLTNESQRVSTDNIKLKKEAKSDFSNDQTGKPAIKVLNHDNQNLKGNLPQKVLSNKKSRKRSSESLSGNVQFKISDCTPSVSSKKKKNEVKSSKTTGINFIEYESKEQNDAKLEEKLKQLVSKINSKYFQNKITSNLGLKSKKIAEHKSLLQNKKKRNILLIKECNKESKSDNDEDQGKSSSTETVSSDSNESFNEPTESFNECLYDEESKFVKFVEHAYAMPPPKANLLVDTYNSYPNILEKSKNINQSKNENPAVAIKHTDGEEILTKCVPSPKKVLNNTLSNKSEQIETAQLTPNKTNEDFGGIILKDQCRMVSQKEQKNDKELGSKSGELELCLTEESQSVCDSPDNIQPKYKVLQIENESSMQKKATKIPGSGLIKINTNVSKLKQFIPILFNKNSGFSNSTTSKLASGKEMPKVVVKLTKNSDSCTSIILSSLKSSRPIGEPNTLVNSPKCDNFFKYPEKQKLNTKMFLPEITAPSSLQTPLLQAPTKTSLLSMDSSKARTQIKESLNEKLKISENCFSLINKNIDNNDLLLPHSSSVLKDVKVASNETICFANEKGVSTIPDRVEGGVEVELPTKDDINHVDLLISTKYKLPVNEPSTSFTVGPEIQSKECEKEENFSSLTKTSMSKSSISQETLKEAIEGEAMIQQPRFSSLGRSPSLIMENSDASVNRSIVTGLEKPDLSHRSSAANQILVKSTEELLQNNNLEDVNRVQHCFPLSDATSEKEIDHSSSTISKPLISCKFINEQDLKIISQETLKGTIEAGAKVQQPSLPILGRSTLLIKENSETSVGRPVVTGLENHDKSNEQVHLMLIKSKSSYFEPPCPFTEKSGVETNTLENPKGPVLGKIESVGTLIALDKVASSGKDRDPSLMNESQLCKNEKLVLPTVRKLIPIKKKFGQPPPLAPIKRLPKIRPNVPPSSPSSSSPPPPLSLLRKGMEIKGVPTTKINVANSNILGTLKKICGKGTGIMNYSNEKVFLTKNSIIIPSHLIRSPPPPDPGPSNNESFGTQAIASNGIKYIRMSKHKLSNIITSLEGQLNKTNVERIFYQKKDSRMSGGSVIELSDDSQNSVHGESQPPEKDSLCPLVISMKDVKESGDITADLKQKGLLLDQKKITSSSRLKVKNLSELLTDPSLAQLMTGNNPSEDSINKNLSEYSAKNPMEASAVNDIETFEPGSVLNKNHINVDNEALIRHNGDKEMTPDVINCSASFRVINKNSAVMKKTVGRRKIKRKKSIWFKNINPKRRPYKWKINNSNRSVISSLNGRANNNILSSCFNSSNSSFIVESTPIKDISINDSNNTMFDNSFQGNVIVNSLPDDNNSSNQIRVAANTHELLTSLKRTEAEKNLLKQFGICNELIICIEQNLENSSGYKYNKLNKCYMLKKRRGRPPKLDQFKEALSSSESNITLPLDSEYPSPPTLKPFFEEDDLKFQDSSRNLMEELKMTARERAEKKLPKSAGPLSDKQSDFKTAVRRIAPLLSRYDQIPPTRLRKRQLKFTSFVERVKFPSKTLNESKDTLEIEVSVKKNEKDEEVPSSSKRSYKRRNKKLVNSSLKRSKFSMTSDKEENSLSPDMNKESPPNLVPEVIEPLTSGRLTQGNADNDVYSISSHKGSTQQGNLDQDTADPLPKLEKFKEISSKGCEELPLQNIDIPPSLEVMYDDTATNSDSSSKNPDQSIEKGSDNLGLPSQSTFSNVSKNNSPSVDSEKISSDRDDSLTIKSSDETNQKRTLRPRKKMSTSGSNESVQNNSTQSFPDHSFEEMDPLKSFAEETIPSDNMSHVKNCFQYFSRPSSFGRKRKVHPKLLKSSCYMLSHLTTKQSQVKEVYSSLNLEKRPQTSNIEDESATVPEKISDLTDDASES